MASSRSCYSENNSSAGYSIPQEPHELVKFLCQTSERALQRIEISRSNISRFHRELKAMPEEQNRCLEWLKASARHLGQSIHQGRLLNARNREAHERTMAKLCEYMEADPQLLDDVDQLDKDLNRLLEQAMAVHHKHYQLENRYDVDDLVDRVQELAYQVIAIEDTYCRGNSKPLTPVEAVVQLAGGVSTKESDNLIERLTNYGK